ncbi:zinc carboxypeptidase family protein (macronuclear) [Tetrahymena thermophila SB210]|uniref:Zinc carboxypeptidase family protein n=1 Tax=Tetrahymena thermophila (strain SB210) TaxID=312017 RepID=W7X9R8_TETTS|nr:zinc carboxypeptidase family protein [Tetrahymena thermophila SB210]EWS76160.1 zinc carboxypeptidase family protein [Tetrahymena thermophila SB210]|eukprot:XP_012651313.1 zinc carboxypeptidase family protein [Tetrahymena thermophila SB210]
MDTITIQNLKCNKHPNKNLQFIQVNDILTQSISTKPLFYCSSCFNHDLHFQSINYLMIDQIFQEAETNIIPKWPPVNNYQIISDLIDLTSNQSSLDYVQQITDFFDQFKEEFLNKIDIIQKKMINEALKYPIDTQQIIKRYQDISNILQFKQLLNNQQPNNLQDHSILCKEFISQMESQKDKNTELLQSLLTQANQLQKNFNMEYPHMIKQQLFTFIDHISFFNLEIPEVNSINHNSTRSHQQTNITNQNNQIGDFKLGSDLIMKLVSNESNFCSDQFLNKLNDILQSINPLLKQFSFKTAVFKENKEQIDFSKISEEKINFIEEYVKHSVALSRGEQQFEQEAKDSLEIKQMIQIVESKMSFLKQDFIQQFEKFLVDVKPFLKQINFTNSFTDKQKFDFFRNINLKDSKLYTLFEENLPNLDLKLFATEYNNGQRDCVVNKKENGYYEIEKLNNIGWVNCISSINLQKDLKYIFRIKVESLNEGKCFIIGLMKNSDTGITDGSTNELICQLQKNNQSVIKVGSWGIDKQLKGAGFKTSVENMIELRLYLKEQILEMLDYPNYEYKLGLDDKYKVKLTQFDDLRFYIGICNQETKIILMDVKIVNEFIY